jgi:hypothetical protein
MAGILKPLGIYIAGSECVKKYNGTVKILSCKIKLLK